MQPTLKESVITFHLTEGGAPTPIIWNFSGGEICLLLFMCLSIIQSLTYISMGPTYLSYTLGYNLILPYFSAQIVPDLAVENSCIGLPSLTCLHHCGCCRFLSSAPYFPALKDASGSSVHFPPESWDRPFLQGALVPLIGEWC